METLVTILVFAPLVAATLILGVQPNLVFDLTQSSVDHLIQVAGVKELILCGQVTEQCIQYSALDAYMRGFEVVVPRDAVAHINPEWAEASFGMMEKNMHAKTTPVADGVLT